MQTIWIDALEFDDYGGFIKDTQFVAEMGQWRRIFPYVMILL